MCGSVLCQESGSPELGFPVYRAMLATLVLVAALCLQFSAQQVQHPNSTAFLLLFLISSPPGLTDNTLELEITLHTRTSTRPILSHICTLLTLACPCLTGTPATPATPIPICIRSTLVTLGLTFTQHTLAIPCPTSTQATRRKPTLIPFRALPLFLWCDNVISGSQNRL